MKLWFRLLLTLLSRRAFRRWCERAEQMRFAEMLIDQRDRLLRRQDAEYRELWRMFSEANRKLAACDAELERAQHFSEAKTVPDNEMVTDPFAAEQLPWDEGGRDVSAVLYELCCKWRDVRKVQRPVHWGDVKQEDALALVGTVCHVIGYSP